MNEPPLHVSQPIRQVHWCCSLFVGLECAICLGLIVLWWQRVACPGVKVPAPGDKCSSYKYTTHTTHQRLVTRPTWVITTPRKYQTLALVTWVITTTWRDHPSDQGDVTLWCVMLCNARVSVYEVASPLTRPEPTIHYVLLHFIITPNHSSSNTVWASIPVSLSTLTLMGLQMSLQSRSPDHELIEFPSSLPVIGTNEKFPAQVSVKRVGQ